MISIDYPLLENQAIAGHNGYPTSKIREVYCAHCKYRTTTYLPSPRCKECQNFLYVVVRSLLTREQFDELGRRDSSPT